MGTNSTRCGKGCNGSTTKNAIVYFPPGTYLVSSTIALPFGTQVIGDANSRPIIVAAPNFVGLGVLSTDEYTGDEGESIDGGDPQYVDFLASRFSTFPALVPPPLLHGLVGEFGLQFIQSVTTRLHDPFQPVLTLVAYPMWKVWL